jgi:hypothetical protein
MIMVGAWVWCVIAKRNTVPKTNHFLFASLSPVLLNFLIIASIIPRFLERGGLPFQGSIKYFKETGRALRLIATSSPFLSFLVLPAIHRFCFIAGKVI